MSMGMANTTNKYKLFIAVIIAVLCCAVVGIVIVSTNGDVESETIDDDVNSYQLITIHNQNYQFNSDLELVLFLGIDTVQNNEVGQSDTIQLLLMDQAQKNMKILSLSRDIMTDIRVFNASGEELGWKQQHLGLAYSYGQTSEQGCQLTIDAISKMLGDIPIINYAAMNMNSIKDLQNIVGTLSIDLTEDYSAFNSQWKKGKTIQLKPEDAEKFLRTRDTQMDYSNTLRMEKHKVYIEAYLEQLKRMLKDDFQQVIQRLYHFYENTVTNITLEEISDYAEMVMNYQIDYEQSFYTIEGKEQVGKYHDEVIIDQNQLQDLKLKLFYKKEREK